MLFFLSISLYIFPVSTNLLARGSSPSGGAELDRAVCALRAAPNREAADSGSSLSSQARKARGILSSG